MSSDGHSISIEPVAEGRLAVRGELNFETARRAAEDGLRAITAAKASSLQVDCAGVTLADSAGLAVLLVWLAQAERAGRELRFLNLPASIRALARISDVEPLIDAA